MKAGFNDKRRYRATHQRDDGKIYFQQNWADEVQNAPGWFKTKEEAADAWNAEQKAVAAPQAPVEEPKRRGRPPKAEVETGIVDA